MRLLSAFFVLALATSSVAQTPVAQTPPMGWNSWNYFAGKVENRGSTKSGIVRAPQRHNEK